VTVNQTTCPQKTGKARYLEDERTCVLPVKLEPGRMYEMWINLGAYNTFRDTNNMPSVPYLLVFETRK